jgi:hypothetical protein
VTRLVALAWPEQTSSHEEDAYNLVVARAALTGELAVIVEAASGYVGDRLQTVADMKAFGENDVDPPPTVADLVRDLKKVEAAGSPLALGPYLHWHEQAPLVKSLIHPFPDELYSRVNKPRLVKPMTTVIKESLRARLQRLRERLAGGDLYVLTPPPDPEPQDLALVWEALEDYETVYVCVADASDEWARRWLQAADEIVLFGVASEEQLDAVLELARRQEPTRVKAFGLRAAEGTLVRGRTLAALAALAPAYPLPLVSAEERKQADGAPLLGHSEPYRQAQQALAAAL